MKKYLVLAAGCVALILLTPPTQARIKLNTLPERERVEIQLDHPNVTLIQEERIVPLVAGVNQVDFSWANTAIDPETILFQVLEGDGADARGERKPIEDAAEGVKVLSVSYPPNEAALVWQVAAETSGPARVRISYILGNLDKSFNYRAVAANDEKTLELRQYIRVQNLANEEFGDTQLWAGFGEGFHKPIGLNETKEMLMSRHAKVPIRKTYTAAVAEHGYLDEPQKKLRIPMHYVIQNNTQSGLGDAALPFGKVRIFQDDGRGTTAFLGEDWGRFTPVDDEMKLALGVAQDIVVRRTIEKNEQHRVAGNLFNIELIVKYEIENFKDTPVTLDVAERLPALRDEFFRPTGRPVEWELGVETTFPGGPDKEESTFDNLLFHAELPAKGKDGKAEKIVHKLHITLKNEW